MNDGILSSLLYQRYARMWSSTEGIERRFSLQDRYMVVRTCVHAIDHLAKRSDLTFDVRANAQGILRDGIYNALDHRATGREWRNIRHSYNNERDGPHPPTEAEEDRRCDQCGAIQPTPFTHCHAKNHVVSATPPETPVVAREIETAREIVKRFGVKDGLFKGPRTLTAVEVIASALSSARQEENRACVRTILAKAREYKQARDDAYVGEPRCDAVGDNEIRQAVAVEIAAIITRYLPAPAAALEPGTLYWTRDADGYPILDAVTAAATTSPETPDPCAAAGRHVCEPLDQPTTTIADTADNEGEVAEARKKATLYFRWAYQLLLALAKRRLADANAENEAKGEPNTWPAGQKWHEMVGSSHSIFLRGARDEAGIPEEAFMGIIRSLEVDVDDLYEAALRTQGEGK